MSVIVAAALAFTGTGAQANQIPAPSAFAVPPAGTTNSGFESLAKAQATSESARRRKPHQTVKPLSPQAIEKIKDKIRNKLAPRARVLSEALRTRAAADPPTSALVLYDNAGPYGFLGELYAMTTANLAGHFGTVTTKPVQNYLAGETEQYTATIYIGSTYYGGSIPDALPDAFYTDVATTAHPVIWMANNIWSFANKIGIANFTAKYGWDPTNSYFGPVGSVTRVDYKTQPLTRTVPAAGDGGILRPYITDVPAVTKLAIANDTSTSPVTQFPWAIRSSNLTYLGEIPYAYVNETDRIIAWHDLLFDAFAPTTATRHRAILRLEDISPNSDPAELQTIANYLTAENIPYAFQVVPVYTDPNGTYNNGVPETVTLAQRPALVNVLKYMLAHKGRIVAHGYTHQFGTTANPYNGVSGDDFEFYSAHVDASDNVILDGPVPGDSAAWALDRVTQSKNSFAPNGLPVPTIWTTPHYAASAADYPVFKDQFAARLERSLFFKGQLTGGPIDTQKLIGQFFPYPTTDVYGGKVLPENLGNYEPEAYNNHPARLPADLIRAAKYNLAVRDGFASFFYHPYFPTAPLRTTVRGIKNLGYTFVDPATAIP
jgi:uncharacterized protein YdaL